MTILFRLFIKASSLMLIMACLNLACATDHPNIMVSIKPFYNLCAKVMESVGEPQLLLQHNASPHDYHLKPSDVKLINSADLIIWGGPELEGYLQKPIENLLPNKNLNLAKIENLTLLPLRTSTNWEEDDHNHNHHHNHDHSHNHHAGLYDPHFWLDPNNAVIMAQSIAQELSKIDPKHAKIYQKNATNFAKQIQQQKPKWRTSLMIAKDKPFIVFHDAYQYFDNFFGLKGVGSISLNPEIPPSAQRIQQIENLLKNEHVQCMFNEPQFSDKIIASLTANMHIYYGQLDPLGNDADLGPNGYFMLINNLVNSFVACGKYN